MSLMQQQPQNTNTTLWMGDLAPWMDERYLQELWLSVNVTVVAKVIRDKPSSASCGYAFVDFGSTLAAQSALDMFHGEAIPRISSSAFRLNWALGGGMFEKREDKQPEYSLFLGDLGPECSEQMLLSLFQAKYASCISVKIVTDPQTKRCRGYGFARFRQQQEQLQALLGMQGCIIGNRPIRISLATPKNSCRTTPPSSPSSLPKRLPQAHVNTTVFVGGLSTFVEEAELKGCFEIFGEIVYAKIPPGKNCGFVQFVTRQSAALAIEHLNGLQIGSSRIRLSWGKTNQQQQQKKPSLLNSKLLVNDTLLPLPSLHDKNPLQTCQQKKTSWNPLDKGLDTNFTRMLALGQSNTLLDNSNIWRSNHHPFNSKPSLCTSNLVINLPFLY